MAKHVQIILTDDLDGSPAAETVTFGLDGETYEIDLSEHNAWRLRDMLAPFVGPARKVQRRGGRRRPANSGSTSNAGAIRAWARENGMEVSERGRIPADIRAAYEAANN